MTHRLDRALFVVRTILRSTRICTGILGDAAEVSSEKIEGGILRRRYFEGDDEIKTGHHEVALGTPRPSLIVAPRGNDTRPAFWGIVIDSKALQVKSGQELLSGKHGTGEFWNGPMATT